MDGIPASHEADAYCGAEQVEGDIMKIKIWTLTYKTNGFREEKNIVAEDVEEVIRKGLKTTHDLRSARDIIGIKLTVEED